jgi:hypothetical protein
LLGNMQRFTKLVTQVGTEWCMVQDMCADGHVFGESELITHKALKDGYKHIGWLVGWFKKEIKLK